MSGPTIDIVEGFYNEGLKAFRGDKTLKNVATRMSELFNGGDAGGEAMAKGFSYGLGFLDGLIDKVRHS
jgi:hypothetical protein